MLLLAQGKNGMVFCGKPDLVNCSIYHRWISIILLSDLLWHLRYIAALMIAEMISTNKMNTFWYIYYRCGYSLWMERFAEWLYRSSVEFYVSFYIRYIAKSVYVKNICSKFIYHSKNDVENIYVKSECNKCIYRNTHIKTCLKRAYIYVKMYML